MVRCPSMDVIHTAEFESPIGPLRVASSEKGLVYVGRKGLSSDKRLRAWVDRGLAFARSQPAKR